MQRVSQFIFRPHLNIYLYCALAGVVCIAAYYASALVAAVAFYALGADLQVFGERRQDFNPVYVLAAVLFAPVIETFMLAAMLGILLRIGVRKPLAAATTALGFAAVHEVNPIGMLGIAAVFFVFSSAYIAWREVTVPKALLAAGVPHALFNIFMSTLARSGA